MSVRWLAGLAGVLLAIHAVAADTEASRQSYVLNCGGCHGLEGVSNSRLVPDLKDQVGYFLNLPAGRTYLVRLPNVAFSMTSDEELSGLLNYMVFTFGAAGVPKGSRPYTAAEVAQWRRRPLTEVSLTDTRQHLVNALIADYHAPAGLRRYGGADYASLSEPQDRHDAEK